MAAVTPASPVLKSAHQIAGRWTWIGPAGDLRSYSALPALIAVAAAEGWQFDHCLGQVGIFTTG